MACRPLPRICISIVSLLFFIPYGTDCARSYKGYKLIELSLDDEQDLAQMKDLYSKSISNRIGVEFLRRPLKVGQRLNLIVGPRAFIDLKRNLYARRDKHVVAAASAAALRSDRIKKDASGDPIPTKQQKWYTMDHEKMKIMIPELQTHFDREKRLNMELLMAQNDTINLAAYNPLHTIYAWLESLAKDYPNRVRIINLGPTWEGRPIKGVAITSFAPRPSPSPEGGGGDAGHRHPYKPAVLVVGCEHAREWITTAVAVNLIHSILKDPPSLHFSQDLDWYIFPVSNPDGYEYTFTTARLWRKNKRPPLAGNYSAAAANGLVYTGDNDTEYIMPCHGVDLNRNWDIGWNVSEGGWDKGNQGTTDHDAYTNACSSEYAGPTPFSEPETKAIRDFVLQHNHELVFYLSLHSYGQLIMFPYAYTSKPPAFNYAAEFDDLGRAMADTIYNMYGTVYTHGQAGVILYTAPGTSMDWVHREGKIKYSMVIELRNTNRYTFMLPQDQIKPTAAEILAVLGVLFPSRKAKGRRGLKYHVVKRARASDLSRDGNFADGSDPNNYGKRGNYLDKKYSRDVSVNKRKRLYTQILVGLTLLTTLTALTSVIVYKIIF